MKPLTPHDPLDDLIAAALHGDLTPQERAQFDLRLQTDAAAQAAYRKAQAMHDLLEKTHQEAQPDAAFEQRMVSGVRRKMETEKKRETAWESALYFWKWSRGLTSTKWKLSHYTAVGSLTLVALGLGFAFYHDLQIARSFGSSGIANPISLNSRYYLPPAVTAYIMGADLKRILDRDGIHYVETAQKGITLSGYVDTSYTNQFAGTGGFFKSGSGSFNLSSANTYTGGTTVSGGTLVVNNGAATSSVNLRRDNGLVFNGGTVTVGGLVQSGTSVTSAGITISGKIGDNKTGSDTISIGNTSSSVAANGPDPSVTTSPPPPAEATSRLTMVARQEQKAINVDANEELKKENSVSLAAQQPTTAPSGTVRGAPFEPPASNPTEAPAAPDTRKLIRNAQLDLEVKSFQSAMDQITALTKAAGGYVDTSNSQKGGNGKLQGTVVVKVLPQNLDGFLLKLRDLGAVQNQSVSTDDVMKDYFDTQARLVNSQKMEAQLQDLLKRENGKVADLLAVERELGRVRGEIEGMQGHLKLYDFQVQYATVTMNLSEKDLNKAAAYLLKEQDDFSLFATEVEGTFQKARAAADDFKAQVLTANLNHNSGTDVSAELMVMVAPDQIEPFLAQVRGLGRVANFTRQTQRVAKDGGDSAQPADETMTEKDKVQVHLTIRSDDETRKQVALTVVAKAVDVALDAAKTAALGNAGTTILGSALNKAPAGQSTAQLTVRVPGAGYSALIAAFKALGRTAALSIQRNDDSGPGANGDDAPVIVTLALTDDDAPLQQTALTVAAKDVDAESQRIKQAAGTAGVEVKASSFQHQPDGSELAQMTFRLPMAKYPAFIESVKALGKVESLTVQRSDRPDETQADDAAPVEIDLQLHNQRDIIADDAGFWATMRQTFGEGAGALFTSVRVIGVIVAFTVPWVITLGVMAWVGRRIYVWRRK